MTSLVLLTSILLAAAQELPTPVETSEFPLTSADYQVGPGDRLSIQVYGSNEFDMTARVHNSGRIHVPYVGVIVAAGLTPIQLEGEIARLIRDQQLVKEPAVRVRVDQQRAEPVYIIGAVQAPGQFMIMGEMYFLDLISKAGGLMSNAGTEAVVYRRNLARPQVEVNFVYEPDPALDPPTLDPPGSAPHAVADQNEAPADGEIIGIDLDGLLEGARPEMNLRLKGGDIVYVRDGLRETFFVIGDVNVPGAYNLPRDSEVTAAQAIIYAGGLLPTASSGSAFLVRRDESGERTAMPIDFRAILDGEESDFPIQADDIIYVPGSALKTVTSGLLDLIPVMIRQFLIF